MSIKALHRTAIPLRFIAAGELQRNDRSWPRLCENAESQCRVEKRRQFTFTLA